MILNRITDDDPAATGEAKSLTVVLTIFGCALMVGAPAATTNPYLIGIAFFLGGAGVSIWNVITVSLLQQITPADCSAG